MNAKPQKIGKITFEQVKLKPNKIVYAGNCECGKFVIFGNKPTATSSCYGCLEPDYIFKPNEIAMCITHRSIARGDQVLIVEQNGQRVKAEYCGKVFEGLAEDFKGTGVIF